MSFSRTSTSTSSTFNALRLSASLHNEEPSLAQTRPADLDNSSSEIGPPIDGMLLKKRLDRTKGIKVDKSTEYTTPRSFSLVYHPPWYPPPPPPSPLDPTKTIRRFDLFTNLPMEMIGCVVQQCTPGDAVALSLTCKTLYSFSRPLILQIDPSAFKLAEHTRSYLTLCSNPRAPGEGVCESGVCERRGCNHCLCVDCPLWRRLVSWMPKDLKFCRDHRCGKFMLRRKFKKGRCYHGSSPRAPRRSLDWSYDKHCGGWCSGGRAWKKYESNADMKVAMDRYLVDRMDSAYGLRKKPKPSVKRMEHVNQRIRGRELTRVEVYGG